MSNCDVNHVGRRAVGAAHEEVISVLPTSRSEGETLLGTLSISVHTGSIGGSASGSATEAHAAGWTVRATGVVNNA